MNYEFFMGVPPYCLYSVKDAACNARLTLFTLIRWLIPFENNVSATKDNKCVAKNFVFHEIFQYNIFFSTFFVHVPCVHLMSAE